MPKRSPDQEPKPCHHPIANHQHGTYACYVLDKCRCGECSEARRQKEATRRKQIAYGRYEHLVDVSVVKPHIDSLREQGMGFTPIAKEAGMATSQLSLLYYDTPSKPARKRITRQTAEKILSVTFKPLPGARVEGVGTVRRLRALVVLGYSPSYLGRELAMGRPQILRIISSEGSTQVEYRTQQGVKELYESLWDKPLTGTCRGTKISVSRAKNYAKARNWLPPMAWDDDVIDDPDFVPSKKYHL